MTDDQLKAMTTPKEPKTTTWAVLQADYGSPELNDALREGWEPFGAVAEERDDGHDLGFELDERTVTVVLLRRRVRVGGRR